MKAVIFRHLPDDGYESAFETINYVRGMVVREQKVPGLFGTKDIYIRHHNFWHKGETVLLVTYTNEDITPEDAEIVIHQASIMLSGRS